MKFKFTFEELADLICEFTKDGARPDRRDVVRWFQWLEKKHDIKTSHIQIFGRRPCRRSCAAIEAGDAQWISHADNCPNKDRR